MASELSGIKDEDLLRKMWQETEDFGRKKEIRAHMYKLREARLKEFYVNEMDSKNQTFDTKAPITTRHGVMADHTSFESLKSNEIHGTDMSDIKFGNTGGWNVITSSELSDDGKARTEKMLATTEGVTAIKGGQKAFSGKNEELKSERFDGDANNYTYTTGESSNMVLNENIVTGDETCKRTESKSSSVSHTSKVIKSSTNSSDMFDNNEQIMHDHDSRRSSVSTVKSSNVENLDNVKLSQDPARVQEAFRLASQPGTIISRKVEKASETQNMITERKELSDGTIVTTRRYEPISSTHSDIHATVSNNSTTSSNAKTSNNTTSNTSSTTRTSKTVESSTSKTSRDEEAFRLSQQPGNIISRDVTMGENNTRIITEKKELSDGTIVTTKRFEKASDENVTKSSKNSELHQTFKTSRDEEAFRLAQQPGKIISRDVTMHNPTTKMIVEKKELTDGTIVTTKRYESVDSSSDTKSVKNITKEHNTDEFAKSLRKDTHSVKNESVKETSEKNFRTSRDEEAFRLAQQPGKIISRDVTMHNPTTKMIVEKKELTDGTIVTTKRYENVHEDIKAQNVKNVDTQNVRKITTENNTDRKTQNDIQTQREVVEETVTKKIFDTSCQCPENMHDHKTRDFIRNERTNDQYNVDSEIITNFHNVEKNREETIKKTEVKKVDQEQKRFEDNRKITRELEHDSAHKAFASSLRSVTPPLEKVSTTRIDRRSPSRETQTSKISSSTTTIRKSSNTDIRKSEDFMRSTQSSDRRTSSKSPEKQVKKSTRTSTEEITKSPQKFTDTPRSVSPTKNDTLKRPVAKAPEKQSTPSRESSPTKLNTPTNSRSTSPQKQTRPRSPQKQPRTRDTKHETESDELLSTTIKIDNIDKTINDLKIIQTIDTKDLSATTSVSDLEYISGSDKRLITDLDSEDIQVKIDIQNVNELDDLTIKTTVSEVDETTKGKKVPFNRSETFEERAKKLIGIKSEDEGHITKEVPSYAKPTKASQAPVKDCSPRVSEIRERKAKIDEIEKTVKRNSITNSTDFIKHERQEIEKAYSPSPERSPTRRKPSNQKEQIDNEEITKITKITRVSSPDKKKPTESTSLSKILDQKPTDPHQRRSRSPTREKTPETHITTAQITISPSRGITSKMVTKTSTVESNKTLKVAPAIKLIKRTSDISSTEPDSETDHELIRNIDKSTSKNTRKKLIQNRKDSAPVTKSTVSSEKEKVSRSISENIIKTDTIKKTATRESPKKESKRPTKCITTKTINLTNVNDSTTLNASKLDNVEVEVTVQQAKSSREPSPNKIIPVPVHTDDEINDDDTLHPNAIIEPDENKPKSKVVNVPIFQEETKQFIGLEITEVGTEKSHVILEEDESNEESEIIQSTTLEKADRKRNSVQIDAIEEDENDDHSHLLSVSQKVNKFNETVDELKKPKASSPFRKEFEVKLEDAPDSGDENFTPKVTEKISKFSKVTEESVKKVEDKMTRSIDEVDEMLKNDECLLSVSDKVNKFTVTAERLSSPTPQKSPELVKNIMKQNVKAKVDNITDSFLNHERSVEREIKTSTKSSDIALKSTEAVKKAREVFEHNSSASRELNRQNDILSRPSVFEAKRSTKVDKKDVKETTKTTTVKSTRESISPDRRSPSKTPPPSTPRRGSGDHHTPVYMKDQVSTKKDLFEKKISSSKIEHEIHHKSLSPQNSIDEKRRHSNSEESHQIVRKISASDKHYMQHTKASLEHVVNEDIKESEIIRTNRHEELEYRRDSLQSPSKLQTVCEPPESPKTPTKFGVELKRTESYKAPQTPRRVSTGSETINIEEIWDLSELERLLEIVVGYEQRRRIRSQIRIVKKKMEEKKMSIETKSKRMSTNFTSSPSRTSRTETVTKTTSQKPLTPRESSSRIITTTTTTTTSKISSDKGEPKVTTKTTKVTSSSPREIIESLNKSTKGKATESVVKVVKKTSATSNTQQKKSNVMREQKAETDCITSSYGVGPTDSNGLPLFGLKALRTKSPSANVESKTTGTVISEVSYSENGGPIVTKRKTTKYSSDPSDFVNESEVSVKSNKTERKTSQGKIYSVSKTEQYEGDKEVVTKTAPKVIRNGSVKELKEKFVRKSSSSKVVEQKSETKRSSVERESETCCSSKHCKSSVTKSFLNNEKRASNVKEVVTMMKNADSVQIEGDSTEDAEARALLNKFIGATALMTSIENSSGLSKDVLSGGAKNKKTSSASKVTKTVTSYSTGKAYDINDIWDVDLLKKILEATTSYDDRRKIRERIRQVMADKEACADIVQQVSAELEETSITTPPPVENNTPETSSSEPKQDQEEEGESLLLPFLKGILQNPKYKHLSARQILSLNLSKAIARQSSIDNSVPPSPSSKMNNSEHNKLNDDNRLGNDFPTIEDSGTESGEDLRLLAAASLNSMDEVADKEKPQEEIESKIKSPSNEALGADLLNEVTAALERLQTSLSQGELNLDDSKKSSLLSLVNRLQLGLISPDKKSEVNEENKIVATNCEKVEVNDIRRGSSGSVNRFSKKKNRANRHTVGVTREELADARRIIEELEMIGMQNSNQPVVQAKVTATVVNSKPGVYNAILTRQISEPVTLLRPSQFVTKDMSEQGKVKKLLFKQSVSLDHPSSILKNSINNEVVPINFLDNIEKDKPAPVKPLPHSNNNAHVNNNNSHINNKATKNIKKNDEPPTDESSSSDDEDMINTKFYNPDSASNKFKAREVYLRNQQNNERNYNYSSGDESHTPGPRQSKYTSKKMKMKRANTVDLPKSFSFVNTFELSDRELSDSETMSNNNENRSSAGLKTTFMKGNLPTPPKFTPKTENDKKFMAFIQKQNNSIMPTYVSPTAPKNEPKVQNWTSKFGNLKNKFQDEVDAPKPVPKANNAAAKFWKSIEKEKPSAKVSPLPPVAPLKSTQLFSSSLPTSTEKFPWKSANEKPVNNLKPTADDLAIKKKQMIEKFEPKEPLPPVLPPRSIPEPNKLPPQLKPSSVNNFSHNPMSVFKPPISRKLSNSFKPITNNEEVVKKPMPQISNGVVKQLAETGYNVNNPPLPQPRKVVSSPTRSIADTTFTKVSSTTPKAEPTPWTALPKSERVLSLAASKFENVPTVHLATHLEPEPTIVRFRNNPLYSGSAEKRQSMPANATYSSFDSSIKKEITPPKSLTPKETTFVITDYTQPVSISTYAPTEKPSLERQDSLTNPTKEPLVLTFDRTVISPREKGKVDLTPPFPVSPQKSDNSLTSICDDLEHELDDLGESIECQAAVSKVMKGPVAHSAYTQSSELTSLGGQVKENSMVKSLHDSLKKLSQKSPSPESRQSTKRLSQESSNSSIDLKLQTRKLPAGENESRLSKDSSNSSIDFLPPLKIPIPAVPETAYSITYTSPPRIQVKSPSTEPHAHVLYNNIHKVKSSHNLSIPKPSTDRSITPPGMYGVPQSLIDQKQKTVASFFTPTAPQRSESLKAKAKPFSVAPPQPKIAPIPAPRKISMHVKPMTKANQSMNSLSRSKTMPSLANVELLDESNIDDAFEELLSSANL